MTRQISQLHDAEKNQVVLSRLDASQRTSLAPVFISFLDAALTATARATFYNSREEQEKALSMIHEELFSIDRGVYAASLLLSGVTDYTRQMGITKLLATPRNGDALVSPQLEGEILGRLFGELPPQRVLKTFGGLRASRVNNARTRKLMLRFILQSPALQKWTVKYRRKIGWALEHAWGKKLTGILRSILAKKESGRSGKENRMLDQHIGRFAGKHRDRTSVQQCVGFALGVEENLTLKRLVAYREAKQDLKRGRNLPYEVLEGIRSRFHGNLSSGLVLDLTRDHLTTGQRIAFQRKAQTEDVEVQFDPGQYDPVRLYLYAYEMGMTDEIRGALAAKARKAAGKLPVRFGRVGVLLDGSASMTGHITQKRRPVAVALALRDLLCEASDAPSVLVSDGRQAPCFELLDVQGDTRLAQQLVALLRRRPETVFIISDGYENAPAGRTAEAVHALRRLGIDTPIFQLSPVFAAESRSVRRISEDVSALPVSTTEALGIGLLKAAFEVDIDRGLEALFRITLPAVETAGAEMQGRRNVSQDK